MDEMALHQLFGEWSNDRQHRGVLVDAGFVPDEDTEAWVDELLAGAFAAMVNAGVEVTREPIRIDDGKVYVTLGGQELLALDVDNGSLHDGVHRILGRLDAIAASRGRRERWNVCGDPCRGRILRHSRGTRHPHGNRCA